MHHLAVDEESSGFPTMYGDDEEYCEDPVYKCKNCEDKNTGYEEKETSIVTLIAVVISLLVFQLYALLLLPLVIEATKTITKKCSKCDHVLDKQELLSVSSLTDKVLNFKCGSCAVVISRKYTLILIAILSVAWFLIPSAASKGGNPGGMFMNTLTWNEFMEDCGKNVILNNQVRAKKNFEEKYAGNIIEWQGVVQQVITKERIWDDDVSAVVRIKMIPTETQQEFADIQLTFVNNIGAKYDEIIKELTPGDVVGFKATMITMSDEVHHNHFEAISIVKTAERMDLGMIPIVGYSENVDETIDEAPKEEQKGINGQDVDSGDDNLNENDNGNNERKDEQKSLEDPEN